MDEDTLVKRRNKAHRDGNVHILADVQKKLGDLFFDKKRYEDALEAYKGQLHACECLGDRLNCAIAHRMIGEVYADIENFSEALSHQNLYLKTAKDLNNLIEEQRAFATLGRTYLLVADTMIRESEKVRKMEVLKDAKKAFSKSIRLCDKLENKIDMTELMMMRARLLLNLGLVLEQQKDTEQALSLIQQAASLCKKHTLHEDLHRSNVALAGINERLGNTELAFKHLDEAAKVDDIYLKADAKMAKAELLLRLGEWMEAQKILHNLYKSKRLLEPAKQHVTKLLRIAVVLCRSEDQVLIETELASKEKLYETMGDAAVAVRSLDKAEKYYRQMLSCAEERNSPQLGAALTSLLQTLRDAGKYQEAIPYARRELELCQDAKESCNSALYLASLLIDADATHQEIRQMFDRALASARECNDQGLERSVAKDLLEYLRKMDDVDLKEIEALNEKLEALPESVPDTESEEEETETADIGADICLDDLSDLETEVAEERPRNVVTKHAMRKPRCVVKKNEKGETQLHVACIRGNIAAVEKLLEEQHPTLVRDHCGWTPLHEASNHGYVDIVRLLIRAGADVNDPGGANCDGVTALHDAAANGHTNIVQLLLDSGADANLLTRSGDSALDCLEQWRERVDDLSTADLKDYVLVKRRLKSMTTVMRRKKRKRDEDAAEGERRWNALVDEDEDAVVDPRPKTVDAWAKPEKISAGEDYKRTIASMQHPGRLLNPPSTAPGLSKITAPLIDSEEALVDDNWLEDDLGIQHPQHRKEKTSTFFNGNGPVTAKRKTKAHSTDGHPVAERSQLTKKQRVIEREPVAVTIEDNSCDSNHSNSSSISSESIVGEVWPRRKKPRQTSLLKQGFVKRRSSSPAIIESETIYAPTAVLRHESTERRSWDTSNVTESVDLEIQVEGESFDLKLHLRDLRKSMSDIEELIRHKFEAKTGCRPKMRFRTGDGVVLAAEVTLEEVPRDGSKLKLFGEITQNELPPILERYKKVSETFSVDVTDSMLKSLRICDNTSTFRLSQTEDLGSEKLEALVRCLRYQTNLQTLNLSGATLFNCGDLLNTALSGLTNLYELHLQCCDIDPEGLACVEKFPVQLRVLDLAYNPLGGASQKKLHELLKPLARLQTLNLRSCELDDFQLKLFNNSLVNLDVSWNSIGGEGAANFLQRQLLSLNLANTQNLAYNRINVIDKIFFSDSLGFTLSTLESLDLSFCQATDLDVEKILSQTPNLTRIKLSNNANVTKTSLSAILARKPTMTHVDLSDCKIIDAPPDAGLRILTPHVCMLLVHMKPEVIDAWELLWQSRGYAKKLPHGLIVFTPTS